MRGKFLPPMAVVLLFVAASAARADELRLKDGTKITGTIVGFENDSFRVETSYGFALIRKDKVADINITAPKKEPEPKPKPAASAETPANAATAVAKETSSPPSNLSDVNVAAAPSSAAATKPDPASSKVKTMATAQPPPPAPPPPQPAAPPPAPEPLVIRDEIRGNLYVNLTYGFQIYKPPSWELIPGARKALPDAVAALGTYDQTTLLVIGRAHAKDSLDAHAANTGKALGDVYENYRMISSRRLTVAGSPAVEQRARAAPPTAATGPSFS